MDNDELFDIGVDDMAEYLDFLEESYDLDDQGTATILSGCMAILTYILMKLGASETEIVEKVSNLCKMHASGSNGETLH
mgnify:CR=1 FL=1